jgi:mannose-6-phosphate isomerase
MNDINKRSDEADVLKLEGVVRHYDWGGHDFIPQLIGLIGASDPRQEPSAELKPFAELWIGAHPQASSIAWIDGRPVPLDRVIAEAHLGPAVSARFGGRLPYLFKVLDVFKMLSIQAHPNHAQAQEGFARESAAGIGLEAANRSYKDDREKTEVGVALTDFWMLHGFRPLDEIDRILSSIPEFHSIMPHFSQRIAQEGDDPQARRHLLRELYGRVMTIPQQHVDDLLNPLLERLAQENPTDKDRPEYWALKAARSFSLPGGHRDRGIFSIYFLNLLHLRPGQGTFQPSGLLHAYLEGIVIELMSNSDNVLRGGLTPKHIDVPELLKILSFESHLPEILDGEWVGDLERVYRTPAEHFELSRIELGPGREYRGEAANGPDALLILQGSATLTTAASVTSLERGSILLIRFGIRYRLETSVDSVMVFKAALPAAHAPPAILSVPHRE